MGRSDSLDPKQIAKDLARHNPHISPADLEAAAAVLIEQIRAAIARGDSVGSLSQRRDGSIVLEYLELPSVREALGD